MKSKIEEALKICNEIHEIWIPEHDLDGNLDKIEKILNELLVEKNDTRTYQYTGNVGVLRGTIIIPQLDNAPGEGQYKANIVLYQN